MGFPRSAAKALHALTLDGCHERDDTTRLTGDQPMEWTPAMPTMAASRCLGPIEPENGAAEALLAVLVTTPPSTRVAMLRARCGCTATQRLDVVLDNPRVELS